MCRARGVRLLRLNHHDKPGGQHKRPLSRICSESFLPKFDFKTLHELSPRCYGDTGNHLVASNGD